MALPKDLTYVLGVRDTGDRTTTTIDPKQPFTFGTEVYKLDAQKHQLLAWIQRYAKREPTDSSRFGHMESAGLRNWVTFLGATETSAGTSGLIFDFPLPIGARVCNWRTGECLRFATDFTGTTSGTVKRADGTTSGALLQFGDRLKLIGFGETEGYTMQHGYTGNEVVKSFRTGIIDEAVELTGTKAAERFVDGDPFEKALFDTWGLVQDQLEAMIVMSGPVDDGSTYTYPYHTPTGLRSAIQTNVWNMSGNPLTQFDLADMCWQWRQFNKQGGALIGSGQLIRWVSSWAANKVIYNDAMKANEGVYIQRYQPVGFPAAYDLVECDLFNQDPTLAGTILFLPYYSRAGGIKIRPLIGNENREIQYEPVPKTTQDLKQGHIFGEEGVEIINEELFGIAVNIQV